MKQSYLEIKSLDKSLGESAAISQLNLSISKGKKIALLGLNGAGKSSFIRLLVGESKPDSGQIIYKIDNQNNTSNIPPQDLLFKKSLGYQSDTMLAISEMTGREYLSLCGRFKGLASKIIEQQIEVISSQWVIEDLLEQPMTALSKGNLQKLAIAQVFIADPDWLFFDEPCQSLDPLEQDRFNQNIKNLNDIRLCIFSTHNVSHALEVADEIILFHQAKIAYRFQIRRQQCQQESDYLLVSKEGNTDLCEFAFEFDLSMKRIGEHVYQIKCSRLEPLEQLKNRLQQAQLSIEFCLAEEQAVMPLFRLLASGEINFDPPVNLATARQVEGSY